MVLIVACDRIIFITLYTQDYYHFNLVQIMPSSRPVDVYHIISKCNKYICMDL